MRLTISRKLFIFFVLPGLLFFSFYIAYSILNTQEIMYSLYEENYADQITGYANLTNRILTETTNFAQNTAKIIEVITSLSEKYLFRLLNENVNSRKSIFGSTIAFAPYAFSKEKKFFAPFVHKTENNI